MADERPPPKARPVRWTRHGVGGEGALPAQMNCPRFPPGRVTDGGSDASLER